MNEPFTYTDLFAGIGGFHAALSAAGGSCAYAVEIDQDAARVYKQNWGHDPFGDITRDAGEHGVSSSIPSHDVLTAGFPCQPFSKSGAQKGMEEVRGTLYFNILQIIHERRPTVLLLENVRNLAGPRHRHEWEVIVRTLREAGYRVASTPAILSPNQLEPGQGGRPQVRERVFITATYNPNGIGTSAPDPVARPKELYSKSGEIAWNIKDFLLGDEKRFCLSQSEIQWINAWDDWVHQFRAHNPGKKMPGFPIWVDEWRTLDELEGMIEAGDLDDTPRWKRNFLYKNAELFTQNHSWCCAWLTTSGVRNFPPSRRKLEWQAQDLTSLWDCLMHFRPSGLRAKAPTYIPALVAITQTSIIGPLRRRISPKEAARLQGFPDTFSFDGQSDATTYKQLGNGVNVGVVWNIFRWHCNRDRDILETTASGRRILSAVDAMPENPDKLLEFLLSQHQEAPLPDAA